MGSQTSSSQHQALSDANQSGFGRVHREGGAPSYGPHKPQQHAGGAVAESQVRMMGAGAMQYSIGLQGTSIPATPARHPTDSEHDANQTVPCVITWTHGGQNVFVTGSFNGWSLENKLRLVRSGNEFSIIKDLPRGVHYYKFIVDDQWKYSPDQTVQADQHGNVNNVLDTTRYQHYAFRIPSEHEQARYATYAQRVPAPAEFSTDAATIPLLLSRSTCVAAEPQKGASIPLHCLSNHVFHDSYTHRLFGPTVSCVAATQRWRPTTQTYCGQKYATFIFVTINPLCPVLPAETSEYVSGDGQGGAGGAGRSQYEAGGGSVGASSLQRNPLKKLLLGYRGGVRNPYVFVGGGGQGQIALGPAGGSQDGQQAPRPVRAGGPHVLSSSVRMTVEEG
uniref:AMP-activated protein kinase glycogen-binding domain-containing protein n=1 Tax=Chromera velia CCMP2878 TaxID=1169474 RepID=A0A0G4H504_9ALVE|mmetsp:Transcript_51285/g.100700  ORF Transcript_51285/g.100700 Transcript_51285/m.100700 type:complete len:392 (+) Transcript_51285:475-1650(+)|eukprot:Cvel_5711.t1-p1 / transcript=Cvel_5711.t1 / gene=Cvel_5711 / organism=Chromera_velia_CCMP2878 / gene_product=SNF1-related protein kinase regulatory subunit, putative / transcript_product=SNF1-related protein kinase regulatory subunit, putative / location=Cvel_scaffold270:55441-60358(+) / protein_length=391 / sequence_SO=supercontig / SO=protein_coding / is_pseudo=false